MSDAANRRTVIIYRNVLLPASEVFIEQQGESLKRYRAVYAGIERRAGVPLPEDRLCIIRGAARLAFRFGQHVTRHVHDRLAAEVPRLVHAHFGPDALQAIPLSKDLRIPLIATFHGFDIAIEPGASLAFRVYSLLRPRVFARAKVIIAVAEHIRQRLVESGCPPGKVRLHHIGVDTSSFRFNPAERDGSTILFVGRLVEKKGCSIAIEAIRRMRDTGSSARLVVIGDGALRAQLESAARDLDVEFLGTQPHPVVRDWMQHATLLCLPSVRSSNGDCEGLPITLLEAQSSGLPIVGTRHPGIDEAIADGETGVLVAEKDSAALAAAAASLLRDRDRRVAIAGAARASVTERFDLTKQAVKLEAIYDEVAGA